MTTFTSLLSRLVLALSLASGAGAALAVPTTYHVNVDTTALSGSGYLDMSFMGFDAGAATAVVSNFTGNASGAPDVFGPITGNLASTVTFQGSTYNYLDQLVQFGGLFGFDILFDFAATGAPTTFAVSLYDIDFSYVGLPGPIATFEVVPGAGVLLSAANAFGNISTAAAVPEPGQWLLMLTGLLLLGAMARRRNR